jgi:hypothetical protein
MLLKSLNVDKNYMKLPYIEFMGLYIYKYIFSWRTSGRATEISYSPSE